MTAETDLLPCPWCGEKLASVSVSEGSTFRWRKVDGCCADGPEVRHNTMADDQEAAEVESRAAAIAAWNTRACVAHATAAKAAEIEALRAEVEMLRDAFSDEDMTAGAHWFGRYVEQKRRSEQLAEEVEALRAEVREAREFRDKMANAIGNDQLRRFIEKHGEPVPLTTRMQEAEARAERLAKERREFAKPEMAIGLYTEDRND